MINVITEHGFPSSIYRYAMDIKASSDKVNVIQLMTRPDIYKKSENAFCVEGFSRFGEFNKILNNLFWRAAFRDGWRRLISDDEIIHYLSGSINPIVYNERSVVTIHDNPYSHYSKSRLRTRLISSYLEKYKNFSNIIVVSNYVKNNAVKYGFNGRIQVIYPPVSKSFQHLNVNKTELKVKLNLPIDKILVLSVSTLQQRKNTDVIPKVLKILGSKYQLIRVGEPLGDSINFSGVSDNVLNEIYNACDVMLFPSLEEGYGYPIVEAMTTGLPVVSNNFSTANEIGHEAIIVCDNKIESFISGIRQAIDEQEKLIEKGLRRSKNFTFDNFKKQINEFYEKL